MKLCVLLLLFALTLCQGTETQYSGYVNERDFPHLHQYLAQIKKYEGSKEIKIEGEKKKQTEVLKKLDAEGYRRQETEINRQEVGGYIKQQADGRRIEDVEDYRKDEKPEYRRQGEKLYGSQEGEYLKTQKPDGYRRKGEETYRKQEEKYSEKQKGEDFRRPKPEGYSRQENEEYKREEEEAFIEAYGYRRQDKQGFEGQKDKYEVYYGPTYAGLEGRRFDGYEPEEYRNNGEYERGYEYKEEPLILGRFGLGFDRRTASSIGLQEPLTLKQLRPVGKGYYGRLFRKGGPIPIEYFGYFDENSYKNQ